MIEGFNVKEQVLGTALETAYTFDFKIYALTDLLIYVQDATGAIVQTIRGDDTTFIESVTFDTDDGGGTVTLVDELGDDYVMTMLLAPDLPDQPTTFASKISFTMEAIEGALDFLASQIQRLAWITQRSVKLHDLDELSGFDPTLPKDLADNPGGIVSIDDEGSGFEIAITTTDVANAQGYAANALASQSAALVSQAAAAVSAAAAAASAAAAQSGVQPYGTRAAPTGITVAGLTNHGNQEEIHFVQGSPGTVIISANPQINVGASIGCRMYIVGRNDAQLVGLVNGTGLSLNGDCNLGEDDVIGLIYDGAKWVEMFRRSAT